MPPVTDQAICIRHWDWSETSQTVSLFCRAHGIVRAVAKGSKRENSRFSGGVEVLTRAEMVGTIKGGDTLAVLFSWDLQETFPALGASLASFHTGMFIADAVHHALESHDPHPALFDAMLTALRGLGNNTNANALAVFLWNLLADTGHKPELSIDIESGSPISPAKTFRFIPRRGGFTHDAPSQQVTSDTPAPAWRVRAETLELLRAIDCNDAAVGNGYSAADATRAAKLLAHYLREVVQTEPPSMAACLARLIVRIDRPE